MAETSNLDQCTIWWLNSIVHFHSKTGDNLKHIGRLVLPTVNAIIHTEICYEHIE